MEIGSRLAELRKKHNLSQKKFSELLNISSGAVGMWETDKRKPDLDMIVVLADFYNVTTDYILCRDSTFPITETKKKLSQPAQKLISTFSQLNEDNQDILIGKAKDLLREQIHDAQLSNDAPMKKVE